MFVERDEAGTIKGIYAAAQPGYAEEEVPDDHADVVAFRLRIMPPKRATLDGVAFLSRFTPEEYQAITTAGRSNAQLGLWIEMLRMRGEIDVTGKTALEAKAGVVAMKLLTQERADLIFAAT